MTRRPKSRLSSRTTRRRPPKNATKRKPNSQRDSRRVAKSRGISDARLESGLRVLSETKDIEAAARSIRVSVERFKRAAKRLSAIRKQDRNWIVVRRLRRKMPMFTGGRQLAITVNSKSASLVGRYMSAVRQFLHSNDPKYLAEFRSRTVKDVRGKTFQFETDPNALYRLSSAGGGPFEEIYRIVL